MQFTVYKKYHSIRKSIGLLSQELDNIKPQLNLTDTDFFRLNICISEIFINAIYHGNKVDPYKYVEVFIQVNQDNIKAVIIDEGNGFQPDNIPDPTIEENLLKDHGRGLFITKNYAQALNFKHSVLGFEVEFILTTK